MTIKRIIGWLDNNCLAILAGFLLVFIPLYPKVPLFDVLYGYNVRARLEDIFVAFTLVVLIIQILRRRIKFVINPTSVGIGIYLIIGLISIIISIFVIQTVPLQYLHVAKTFLHWLRRIEYFSLFFILFSSIKSARIIRIYIILILATLFAVIVYGYGQKYLYWPAFSTMNREFSKGWVLYLSEHARVLSTFGGHYDLAAYLVIVLTLGWSLMFGYAKRIVKLAIGLLLAGGFWLLILTASRSSFAAYMLGVSAVIFFWMFHKGIAWALSRWLVFVFFSMLIMLSFGDLSDRFLHLLRLSDRVETIRSIVLRPAGIRPNNQAVFLENNTAAVTSKSDQPPTPVRPSDVTGQEMPLFLPEKTASGAAILVQKPRTYSQNAVMYDLSTGIRLDATWPRAIAGFKADPLFGSGYATLTKTQVTEFTEGESTDNDYLRSLGETGILGFLSFFGTIVLMAWIAFKSLGGIKNTELFSLAVGLIGIICGLLANALLVDIFEASKVAYVFWGISGLTMGSLFLNRKDITANQKPLKLNFSLDKLSNFLKKVLVSDRFWVLVIVLIAFGLRLYKFNIPVADWHSWRQADTSAVSRNFDKARQINWLYPTYDDLSSIASGKPNPAGLRFVEFPLYNAASYLVKIIGPELNIEESGRVTTALMSVLTLVFIFLLCRKILSRKIAYLAAIVFGIIPYNIYYGRAILPDPSMVATALGAVWFSLAYLESGRVRNLIPFVIFSTASLLIKPYAIFILASIGYLLIVNIRANSRRVGVIILLGGLSLVPLVFWRYWISHFPYGVPASDWLLNGDGIRFKGAFWYWLFADRIGRLILGYWGLIFLALGVIKPLAGKYRFFPLVLAGTSVAYLVVFATGNVRHDYYQILITPALAILVGMGVDTLLAGNWRGKVLTLISVLFMLAFGWYFIKDFYNINHQEIVEAGKKLRDLTEYQHKTALVIAPYDGDTAFLYQTNHQGWPIMEGTIDDMIKKGAHYYVSVKFDTLTNDIIKESWPQGIEKPENIKRKYTLLEKTDKYVIVQLVPTNKLPD